MILTIDPGLRGCGVAVFSMEGEMLRAAYVENPSKKGADYEAYQQMGAAVRLWYASRFPFDPKELLIEHPVVYPGMPQTDLNDLLAVVACGTACAQVFFCKAVSVTPSSWKGNVKKSVMTARIHDKLYANELANIEECRRGVLHNLLDAAGIALHRFQRLNTKVFPGATK
jgi:hypothetical protein